MAFLAFGAVAGGAAVWLQKIIKEENEAREEKLEVQTKEIECLKKQLRDISVLEEVTSTPETEFSESYKDYEEGPHSIKLRKSEIEEKLNSLQSEKEDVVKENEKLVEVTEKLRQNEVQLDAKRKYLEQKCKDLQLRIESLDIQSKSLEADKKNLETTLKEALVAEKFEGRKALANELKEELGVLLTAYRAGCLDGGEAIDRFLATVSQACPESSPRLDSASTERGETPRSTEEDELDSSGGNSDQMSSIPLRIKDQLLKNAMRGEAVYAELKDDEKEHSVSDSAVDPIGQESHDTLVENIRIADENRPSIPQIPLSANQGLRSPPFLKNRRPLRDCANVPRKSEEAAKNQVSKPTTSGDASNFTLDEKGDAVLSSKPQKANRHQVHRRKHLQILRQSKTNVEMPAKSAPAPATIASFDDENCEIHDMTVSKGSDSRIKPVFF